MSRARCARCRPRWPVGFGAGPGGSLRCGGCRTFQGRDRAEGRRRAVHQPGLLVLPHRRRGARTPRQARRHRRPVAVGRLLGLPRLEGHAGESEVQRAPARLRQGARRRGDLYAPGGRERRRARQRQRREQDRATSIDKTAKTLAASRVSIKLSEDKDKLVVEAGSGAEGDAAEGSHAVARRDRQERDGAHRARREPGQDGHLPATWCAS